jgi:lipoprotein-anchoring transpeptidase ErfK/SrfK
MSTSLKQAVTAGLGLAILLATAGSASALTDRAEWLRYLHAQRAAATEAVVREAPAASTPALRDSRAQPAPATPLPTTVALRGELPMSSGLSVRGEGPPQLAAAPAGSVAAARPMPQIDPAFLPADVSYTGKFAPGTIVIDTEERYLYLVKSGGQARRYGVGVGRPGFQWAGTHRISMKREWPGWTPPPQMRKRQPELPAYMEGGPNNPLGARAMYLGSSLYRIHGSNQPWTIGHEVSSGCIRMRNEDVTELYDQVKVGTKVVVLR